METERMNTESDELQTIVMVCAKCGKEYRSNVVSAYCEDCTQHQKHQLPTPVRRLGNQIVVDAGLPDTDD